MVNRSQFIEEYVSRKRKMVGSSTREVHGSALTKNVLNAILFTSVEPIRNLDTDSG
jgi:hypothetical protein